MYDLSILIPARNEMFLKETIEDILKNIRGNTEIIVNLDGYLPDPQIPQHERLTVIYHNQSIGQRAGINACAKLSKAKYVMKVDAHTAFDEGFDVKMMDEMSDDVTMVPTMKNLHAFDWICEDGHRRYQSPSGPCETCGKETKRDILWRAKPSPNSNFFRFDNTLHFKYWGELGQRPESQGDIAETMSIQGSCFMLTREKYWDLEICDERHGSWGQQGVEVACKTWLSGGRVLVNKKTWYAHMFRTQGGDFGFPYPNPGSAQEKAREYSRDMWFNNKWPKAIHKLEWLIEKFAPVPDWHTPSKNIIYYTCNTHKPEIDESCRVRLKKSADDIPIICVSLNKSVPFGDTYITLMGERSPLMMHKQILRGLDESKADIVFLCESDVLYHSTHFDFTPPRKDVFYYNVNTYKYNWETGQTVFYLTNQVSGVCAYRELLLEFYKKKVEQIEKEGFNRHYEPGQKSANEGIFPKERGGKYGSERWMSKVPNVDIRHDKNITTSKWKLEDFRDPKTSEGWKEVDQVPGWGKITNEYIINI